MPAAFISQPDNSSEFNQVGHGFTVGAEPFAATTSGGLYVAADSDDPALLATVVIKEVVDADNIMLAEDNDVITVPSAAFTVDAPVGCSSTTPGLLETFAQTGGAAGAITSNVLGYALTATTFRYGKERAIGL